MRNFPHCSGCGHPSLPCVPRKHILYSSNLGNSKSSIKWEEDIDKDNAVNLVRNFISRRISSLSSPMLEPFKYNSSSFDNFRMTLGGNLEENLHPVRSNIFKFTNLTNSSAKPSNSVPRKLRHSSVVSFPRNDKSSKKAKCRTRSFRRDIRAYKEITHEEKDVRLKTFNSFIP
ncbi:hypothetical protein E1A91_D01G048000v1 [Gossypium mustelinum]|uniref:Uncharacterized protein n=1 Tax=Gossypium mustelinum TaxID=34275 RepID=A0A5D2W528_GOSMU|nr:hypothetical protein E1A91_D01G048000v1 [Gossypium mustelinum]